MNKVGKNKNNRGFASLEAVSLLFIFVVLLTYCFGTFGIVHTGIMNSISARAYAFETFRNRSDLTFFRDWPASTTPEFTTAYGFRAHSVFSEHGSTAGEPEFWATERMLTMGQNNEIQGRSPAAHHGLQNIGKKREDKDVNPVWIKTVYGICLNHACQEVTGL